MHRYRGRFAPSPTGPLHFGSLLAAAGSYLDAKSAGGEWLVRMEDVDEPRTVPGAGDQILRTLAAFGMESDVPVVYQSERKELYRSALDRLRREGLAYGCGCSRKDAGDCVCRNGLAEGRRARAWRLRVPGAVIRFEDRVMGLQEETSGDFVVLRADGYFAYQLAVVVDDAEQGVTDVVRGADLLDSTARQIALQEALGLERPRYLHLPVALNADGEKLSKQTRAPAIDVGDPVRELVRALQFLGQDVPPMLGELGEVWRWAIAHWDTARIPRTPGTRVL